VVFRPDRSPDPGHGKTDQRPVLGICAVRDLRLSGYSANADQKALCDWVKSMPKPPDEIRLAHGEPEAQKSAQIQT
ncbi:MAG: hypothetical protein K9K21_12060, partial [Desulfotignum sp.]|nr:hypothetical protein [Desulfotignum sp.]